MPETNCFKTPSLCFQDLGTRALCCSIDGAGVGAWARLICLQGTRAHFGAFKQSCSPSKTGRWSSCSVSAFVSIQVCLPAETHLRQRSWRAAMQPCWVSAGSAWLLGVNAWPEGRNVKPPMGPEWRCSFRLDYWFQGVAPFVIFQPFLAWWSSRSLGPLLTLASWLDWEVFSSRTFQPYVMALALPFSGKEKQIHPK